MRWLMTAAILAALVVAGPPAARLQAQPKKKAGAKAKLTPLTEDERINHLLSRLTFGPRPGDVAAIKQIGIDKWITQQLAPEEIPDPKLSALKKKRRTLGLTHPEILALYEVMQGESQEMVMDSINRIYDRTRQDLEGFIIEAAHQSERQLFEVLADFWRNHFSVHIEKDSCIYTSTHYEMAVIRPHLMGGFHAFLRSTAKHPAMLVFLDNHLSRRPPSRSELASIERKVRRKGATKEQAKELAQIAKQRGLNENYARELMELHTLGVDNGYTQNDVEQVARAFTGWSVNLGKEGKGFDYRDTMHDPSRKKLMGKGLPRGRGDTGIIEGETILRRLSSHKNTAQFIAKKLTRYLVNDNPPQAIVDVAAQTFRRTKGNLRAVTASIIKHPEFFDRAHYRAKFKTPLEFVISTVRATNAEIGSVKQVVKAVARLGMPIYGCEDPTGWSDTAEAWRDPGVMALRWRFALNLARKGTDSMSIPDEFFAGLSDDPLKLMEELIHRIVPSGLGPNTFAVLERVVFKEVQNAGSAKHGKLGDQHLARTIVGVLLGSPEFQQQ